MKESERWNEFSREYDDKVFSLTKFEVRRKQIRANLKKGYVLNMGCGPAPYLNRDLVSDGNIVYATDFCREMLDEAKKEFTHHGLEYVLTDSRDLMFPDSMFDTVISVNSILPPERKDVWKMADEAYRVLKKGGVFIAFLCSYDNVKNQIANAGLDDKIDDRQLRVWDTGGWQCFHTPTSIMLMATRSGFRKFSFRKVELDTEEEIAELNRLYDIDTSGCHVYEYLLTAKKT